jgi:Tfp pilus assembly protein PilW
MDSDNLELGRQMLTGFRPTLPRLGDDRGLTLIEMLVAALTGVIVVGALFAILEVSLHQTTLITDKVQANQLGRTAMTRIIDELHSACLSPGFKPVQAKSSEDELRFVNAYSSEAVIPNAKEAKVSGTGAFEHQIVWSPTADTLTDYTYKSTSGEGSEAKFPEITSTHANATPTTGTLLAGNVTQTESTPIFKYYKYHEETTSSSSEPVSTLLPISYTSLLGKTEAEETASVLVSFRVAPTDDKVEHNQYIDVSNQVTFAFSAPNAETPILDSPCE